MSESTEHQWESAFRHRMKALREQNLMTQSDLALRASEAGLAFHQQTIQRIESGSRPIRLNEAGVIAMALNAELTDMTRPESPEVAGKELTIAARNVSLAAWNLGMPVVSDMAQLLRYVRDSEQAHENYVSVCQSQNLTPSTALIQEYEADRALGLETIKFLKTQATAWEAMASTHPNQTKFDGESDYWGHLHSELARYENA